MNKLMVFSCIAAALVIGVGIVYYLNLSARQKPDTEMQATPPVSDTHDVPNPTNNASVDVSAMPGPTDGSATAGETAATTPASTATTEPASQTIKKPATPTPSIQTNPLKQAPDLNPVNQGNPIRKIKTNPFE